MNIIMFKERKHKELQTFFAQNTDNNSFFISNSIQKNFNNFVNYDLRHLLFSGRAICFCNVENNSIKQLALFLLPSEDYNLSFSQILALNFDDNEFVDAVFKKLSLLKAQLGIEKIVLNTNKNIIKEFAKKQNFELEYTLSTIHGKHSRFVIFI